MSFLNNNKKNDKIINSSDYIFCYKCGEPMKPDARCCMKCGALNYDHPDNSYMKNYISVNKETKKTREKFEESKDNDDVYVGGQKLEEVNIKEEPKVEYKKRIYVPINIILVVLFIIGFIIYLIVK